MKPDPENNIKKEGGSLIADLELKLTEEKERYELLKSESELARYVACQEAEKYRRDYFSLQEKMGRMVEDCNILRERELKDEEKIKGLLVEIERKEREFKDKFVEINECGKRRAMNEVSEWKKKFAEWEAKASILADEIVRKDQEIKKLFAEKGDLACAKKRAEDEAHEWMYKYKELQARELRLEEEITQLKEKQKEGFPMGSRPIINIDDDPLPKSHKVDFLSTPEQRSKRKLVVDNDDADKGGGDVDDRNAPSQMKGRKLSDMSDVVNETSGSCKVQKSRVKKACNKVSKETDAQNQSSQESKALKVTDRGIRSLCKSTRRPYSRSIGSGPQLRALKRAEEQQSNLRSSHPYFIKSMVKSNVSGGFWLGLPSQFCKENLPAQKMKMVLEDEKGLEYNVVFIANKTGFSGGWKGFALAHHLELEDALIFQLCEPTRFKVYIIKANLESSKEKVSDDNRISAVTPILATPIQSLEQDVDLSLPQK